MIANESNLGAGQPACRVLLVDNDDGVREALAELLATQGFSVDVAANGEDALARLKDLPTEGLPDVILLDLMMPVMDGWRFTVEMRADTRLAALPVVILSAVRPPLARAARADAYLSKPLDVKGLRETLHQVAGSRRALLSGSYSSSVLVDSTASK